MYVVNMGSSCSPRAGHVSDYQKENNGPKGGARIIAILCLPEIHMVGS